MNHIQSPRTCDASIEEEILAKGLTAPRITANAAEANIKSEHYFLAGQGNDYAVMQETGDYPAVTDELELLTICVLVLQNGFTVLGKSACASPENFDAAIGKRIARANAVNEIWPLMGYQLKQKLHDAA